MTTWTSTQTALPPSGKHVLALQQYRSGKRKVIVTAFYCEAWTMEVDSIDLDFSPYDMEVGYDPKQDKYFLKEGWYELVENWDELGSIVISEPVTHWMEMPEIPKIQGSSHVA